jgi:hypothetical protein
MLGATDQHNTDSWTKAKGNTHEAVLENGDGSSGGESGGRSDNHHHEEGDEEVSHEESIGP